MEEILKDREKIFNHSLDLLCTAGFDGYFKVLNPAWEKTLGWSTQELLDQPWLTYVHPDDRAETQNVKASMVGGQEVFQFENRFICKDGNSKWLSWNSFPYPEEGIMFGVARDITDRKKIEDSLRFSENRYRLLFNEMEEGFALHEIICNSNGTPVDYRFLELNPSFERQTGLKRDELIGNTVMETLPETEPYWIEAYGKVALLDETLHYENYSSALNKWFSVSAFCPKRGLFATTITDITERKQADDLLQGFAMELNVAYDATLQGWANALELREHETAGHSHRVVQQTLMLAQELQVHPHELIHMERGALLHDIGKMGIPDSILLKPGSLTDDEWQIMRQHPMYAYNLLNRIDYLKPALDIPYAHHEKWDGSGYPRKLKGEAIPLSARIFAVIDVWDALSSNRPYRPAWEKDSIIQYLNDQSGKHFDPQVIQAFLQLLDNGKV
jgi:PAS domain S-box-containing protein